MAAEATEVVAADTAAAAAPGAAEAAGKTKTAFAAQANLFTMRFCTANFHIFFRHPSIPGTTAAPAAWP